MSREDEQARKDRNARMWEARMKRANAWKAAHAPGASPQKPTKTDTCSHCGYCEPKKNLHCGRCCDLGQPF